MKIFSKREEGYIVYENDYGSILFKGTYSSNSKKHYEEFIEVVKES